MARQDISIIRGTSNVFTLSVANADGSPFILEEGQSLIFAVKKRLMTDNRVLIKKIKHRVDEGTYYLELMPEDTKDLELGKYYYDVGLQYGEKIFFNIIEASIFEIRPNISQLGDGNEHV